MIAAGIMGAPLKLHVARPTPGKIVMPNASVGAVGPVSAPGAAETRSWLASITARDAAGKVAGHRELLVSASSGTVVRGITDAEGMLHVYGLLDASVSVAFVDDVGARAEAKRPPMTLPSGAAVALEIRRSGAPCPITGTWLDAPGGSPKVGHFLALVPRDNDERRARQVFLTRSVAITTIDSNGRFTFEPVPPGSYHLRTGEGGELPLDVVSSSGAITLSLIGTGESIASSDADAPSDK